VKQIRKRLTYANVMSSIAVFMVLGGAAFAAVQLPKNSVGPKQLKKNAVTKAKIKKNAVNGAKVQDGSLTGADINASGLGTVPSATNAANADKLNGLSSSAFVAQTDLLWALIDADTGTASVVRGDATGASSPGTGRYVVTFGRDITTCGIVATLGDATAETGSPGEISLDQPVGNSVEVNTYDSEGVLEDQLETNGFYITVTC
jgi:hypothetical protein